MRSQKLKRTLQKLSRECARLGGKLVFLSSSDFAEILKDNDVSGCPFDDMAINWRRKTVYVDNRLETPSVCSIIHEMGHVFAGNAPPNSSKCIHEFEWFGWEVCLAKRLGIYDMWSDENGNYVVGEQGDQWYSVTGARRSALVHERVKHAINAGYVTKKRRPLSMRA